MNRERVGLFGGTFNPLHMGHINSMLSITKKMGLNKVFVIPANQSPLKSPTEGPSAEDRLEMVKEGLSDYDDVINVDEQEVLRGGVSYTIDTIKRYSEKYECDDLFLIVGLDQFKNFDLWRDYAEILKSVNLVVTSRPGGSFPEDISELPKGLIEQVDEFDKNLILLTSGRQILFVTLNDIEVSASDIRKKIRTGKSVARYLPLRVEEFIKDKGLYKPTGDRIGDYEALTKLCADSLFAHKAISVRGFDLRLLDGASEYTLVASGTSTKHTQSLADYVARAVKEEYGVLPYSYEGHADGKWVLVDFGALIVHIFYDYVRYEYKLEELWKGGKELQLVDPFISKNEN